MGIFGRLFGKKEDLDLDAPPIGAGLPGENHPMGTDPLASPSLSPDPTLPQDNLGLEEKPIIPESQDTSPGLPPHLQENPMRQTQPALANPTLTTAPGTPQRDLELINSKLDTLKAILSSLDQRTANLEKAAGVEQNKKMPW